MKKLSERMFTGAEDLKLFSGIEQDYLVVLNAFAAEVRKLEAVVEAARKMGEYFEADYNIPPEAVRLADALAELEDTDG